MGITRWVIKHYWLDSHSISTGKYSVMSLEGRGRDLPEALPGPWGLSASSSHQEGCFSEYRVPQICAWCAPLTCQCFQAFPSTWKQSGSGWFFFHFSVEKYSQKERSMSAHQQESEQSWNAAHRGSHCHLKQDKMLQLMSWAWLYPRIDSWCNIKHLGPYGKYFYDCFVIS